jgi:HEAT repeat protein
MNSFLLAMSLTLAGDEVNVLLQRLANTDPAVRREAAFALGELKEEAKPAIPALVGALTDVPPVSNAAGEAL